MVLGWGAREGWRWGAGAVAGRHRWGSSGGPWRAPPTVLPNRIRPPAEILYASRIPPRPANLRWQRCFGCRRPTIYPLSATGLLLHCSGTAIASKGCLLRAPERSLGAPRCHLEASGCHLEASGRQLGGSGSQLGGSWRPSSYNAVNTPVFNGLLVSQGPSRRVPWVVGGESPGSLRGVGGESAGSPWGVPGNLWRPGKTAYWQQK